MKVGIEHHGGAPRAASPLKFVLDDVVDDFAAVNVVCGDITPLFPTQILQNPTAERAQIARYNQIVSLGSLSCRAQMRQYGVCRGGGKCQLRTTYLVNIPPH